LVSIKYSVDVAEPANLGHLVVYMDMKVLYMELMHLIELTGGFDVCRQRRTRRRG
jgi:hypothetical protein